MMVALILVMGLALVVYARQSRPAADASRPEIGDHWHMAYGFNVCGEWIQLAGDKEERDSTGNVVSSEFATTGIHSHNDGLIHWHANSRKAVGRRATLSVFLKVYGVEVDADGMQWPDDQQAELSAVFGDKYADGKFEDGKTTCTVDGKEVPGAIQVVAWDNYQDTGDGTTYVAAFNDIRVDRDAMVFTIAFVPKGTDVKMPPWAKDLPELGASDGGQLLPDGESPYDAIPPGEQAPTITAGESQTGVPPIDVNSTTGSTPASTPDSTPASTPDSTPATGSAAGG